MDTTNYLTVEEVATYLQIHWQTVLSYIKQGELEAVRLDKGYRISRQSLDEFTAKRSQRTAQR